MSTRRIAAAACVAALGVLTLGPAAARAESITNGGFEVPVVGVDGISVIEAGTTPAGFAWTVDSGTVEVLGQGYPSLPGPSFEGLQHLDLNGISPGSISQSFATLAGQPYLLRFAYANNYESTGAANPATATVSVLGATGAELVSPLDISHGTSTASNLNWTIGTLLFTATGSSATIRFASTSLGTSAGGILLDGVSVTLVPEPASAVLLGIGTLGLLCLGRRRLRSTCS